MAFEMIAFAALSVLLIVAILWMTHAKANEREQAFRNRLQQFATEEMLHARVTDPQPATLQRDMLESV